MKALAGLLLVAGCGLAVTVTTAGVSVGQVGVPYSSTLAASGGVAPYTWSLAAGTLCAGLSLSSAGLLSGTPTTAQTCSFTVEVIDADSSGASQALSVTVAVPSVRISGAVVLKGAARIQ
jgi:hypothetical protein